jgi:hypothetical protein
MLEAPVAAPVAAAGPAHAADPTLVAATTAVALRTRNLLVLEPAFFPFTSPSLSGACRWN